MSQNGKVKLTIFQKMDKFGDLFFVNILFVISCVPIITIGAAWTAMYSFTIKLVNDEEETVWKGYWKAFKANFKQATKAWLVVLAIFLLMFGEFWISYSMTGFSLSLILGLMAIEAVFLSFTLPLLFPLISRYENTTFNMFKNAFLLNIGNIGTWFYLFFLWVLPVAVYAVNRKLLYYTWVLWLVILIAVLTYASSKVIVKLFEKIEKKEENSSN
ncbi:MAG: YesL family protein [Coprococcus sp.]